MSGIDKSERAIKKLFIGKCWSYLNNNFSKFSETNKIKIAMELCKKDIPQQLEGEIKFNKTPDVFIGDTKLEYDIGSRIVEYTKEAGDTS